MSKIRKIIYVYCTQNLGHKIGGAVFMSKLTRKERKDKNRIYSKEFKLQTINRVLVNFESARSVAIDIGLISRGILDNWLSKFKENGYNVIEKKRGRKPKAMTKPKKKNDKALSEKDKIKQLEDEILYLKAENEYLKKLRALVQERELKEKKK